MRPVSRCLSSSMRNGAGQRSATRGSDAANTFVLSSGGKANTQGGYATTAPEATNRPGRSKSSTIPPGRSMPTWPNQSFRPLSR